MQRSWISLKEVRVHKVGRNITLLDEDRPKWKRVFSILKISIYICWDNTKILCINCKQWDAVELKLMDTLFAKMDEDPDTSMPTFNRVGAGWINGVKILKYKDDPSLTWVKKVVVKL